MVYVFTLKQQKFLFLIQFSDFLLKKFFWYPFERNYLCILTEFL